jgi:hypothetical protein
MKIYTLDIPDQYPSPLHVLVCEKVYHQKDVGQWPWHSAYYIQTFTIIIFFHDLSILNKDLEEKGEGDLWQNTH